MRALTIDGVDYYRNPYHEVYSVQGFAGFRCKMISGPPKNAGELYVNFNAPGVIEPVIRHCLNSQVTRLKPLSGGK